ncbi:MAG: ATP-binding cassette domain-containing protein [Candidatus Margulisbacteria bacterium]|jgi:iron complex transport system ATP-binding protein|nr:ATP-binding cassette domain-containing protein [Candidatus Margulisiibacteriota bacterium]
MGVPFLQLNQAAVVREGRVILNIPRLNIELGEQAAILGPNGAGKSTLLKLLAGDIYPVHRKKAAVKLFGQERWDLFTLRHRLAVISPDLQEQYQRHSECTGREIILSGLFGSIGLHSNHHISREQQKQAGQAALSLGLKPLLNKAAATFSSGELRRFMIGRALINQPQIIALDEPTVSLDIKARAQFLQNIRGLAEEGRSIIMVTHLLEEIIPEIKRVIVLKDGGIFADGAKEKILTGSILSQAFGLPLKVAKQSGYYYLRPNCNK